MDSTTDLEKKKLQAELKKLEVETAILQKPWYKNPNLLLGMSGMLFGILQFVYAQITVESVESQSRDNKIVSEYINETLIQKNTDSEKTAINEGVEEKSDSLSMIIDVWALNVSSELVNRVKERLKKEGHVVGFGGLLNSRPSWLAYEPTVFHYDNSSKQQADLLAKELKKITGFSFVVKRGAGLGVNKGEESSTFFIHLVR